MRLLIYWKSAFSDSPSSLFDHSPFYQGSLHPSYSHLYSVEVRVAYSDQIWKTGEKRYYRRGELDENYRR